MGKLRKFTAEFADRWRQITGRTPQVLARGADAKVSEIQRATKLSPKEIADRVGVSERTVKAWQSGKREPKGKTATRLNQVMTDELSKREQARRERSERRGNVQPPAPPTPRGVSLSGAVKVGKDRARPRTTHRIEVGQGGVTEGDIARLIAAQESGDKKLADAEAGRVLALAWGIPVDSTAYTIEFPGGVHVF